jgi:endonuclease/exonuclease/phosphatase family metal-dependent hydrolase
VLPLIPRILAVLGTILGLQAMRAFLPLLVYAVRDRFGVSSVALGGMGFLLFATAFLMPRLVAACGPGRALASTVLALAAARGALQLWVGEPLVSLGLAALAVVAFLAFLAALSRELDEPGPPFLVGALLDTVLHAAAGTRDLHWGGMFSDLAAWTVVAPTLFLALWSLRSSEDLPENKPVSRGIGLLTWGPFLFLHLEWFGNVARLSSRTFLPTGTSGALVALGLAAGVLLARHLPRRGFWAGAPAILLTATFFGRGLVWSGVTGSLAYPTLVLTQLAGATLLARAFAAPRRASGLGRDSVAFGSGFILFLLFVFGHYAGYDISFPLSRTALFLVAAFLLLAASIGVGPSTVTVTPRRSPLWAGLLLLPVLVPLVRPTLVQVLSTNVTPRPGQTGYRAPIKIVTFNLHNGFDERGGFALDQMLANLRGENADLIALQEVSRGWLINGSADLFELTREAMGMPGVPAPSVTSDWGNAVFARWEPNSAELVPLPPDSLRLPRSVVLVNIAGAEPGAPELRVLATHFHHRKDEAHVRETHARFLLEAFAGKIGGAPGILLGDFNSLPDSSPLAILRRAGWHDAFDPDDVESTTYPSKDPIRRIDTIFWRGPLRLDRAEVAPPWGSDHRAVIAEIFPEASLTIRP